MMGYFVLIMWTLSGTGQPTFLGNYSSRHACHMAALTVMVANNDNPMKSVCVRTWATR